MVDWPEAPKPVMVNRKKITNIPAPPPPGWTQWDYPEQLFNRPPRNQMRHEKLQQWLWRAKRRERERERERDLPAPLGMPSPPYCCLSHWGA